MPALQELQVLLKARDQASKVFEKTGTASQKAAGAVSKHWKGAALAMGAASVALEGILQAQKENTKAVQRFGQQMGISDKEVRGMAVGLANVTFPLEDVLALMELAIQRGLDSRKAIEDYATFWDLVGDATGLAGPALAKAGLGLTAVGIRAGQETEALATFGAITTDTLTNVQEFLDFIQKNGKPISDLALDIATVAAIVAALEQKFGLAGRAARSEFSTAIDKVTTGDEGSLAALMTELGLTQADLDKFIVKIQEAGGVMEEFAQINKESFTTLDKLRHWLSEVLFVNAPLIESLSNVVLGLAAIAIIGPAVTGAVIAIGAVFGLSAAAALAWAAVIALVAAAVVAAGVLIWQNWETIKETAIRVFGFIASMYTSWWGWLLPFGPLVKAVVFFKDHWRDMWESVRDTSIAIWDTIKSTATAGINHVITIFNKLIDIWNALEFKVPAIGVGRLKVPGFTISTPDIPNIPSLKHGGIVPGPLGAPQLVLAHGGEAFSGVGAGASAMGLTVVNHFHGDIIGIDTLEDFIQESVRDTLRRGGFDRVLSVT